MSVKVRSRETGGGGRVKERNRKRDRASEREREMDRKRGCVIQPVALTGVGGALHVQGYLANNKTSPPLGPS